MAEYTIRSTVKSLSFQIWAAVYRDTAVLLPINSYLWKVLLKAEVSKKIVFRNKR